MGKIPPRQTIGEYCRRIDKRQFSPGFQLANIMAFDIKNTILAGLRDNLFDDNAIRYP